MSDDPKDADGNGWTAGKKAGAAVGSAAILAALMFAGRGYKRRQEEKAKVKPRQIPEGRETD